MHSIPVKDLRIGEVYSMWVSKPWEEFLPEFHGGRTTDVILVDITNTHMVFEKEFEHFITYSENRTHQISTNIEAVKSAYNHHWGLRYTA